MRCLVKKHVWLLKSVGGGFTVHLDGAKGKLVCPFFNPFCPLGVPSPTEEYKEISLAGKVRAQHLPISPFQSADTSRRTQKAEMLPQNVLPASWPLSLPLSTNPEKVCFSQTRSSGYGCF